MSPSRHGDVGAAVLGPARGHGREDICNDIDSCWTGEYLVNEASGDLAAVVADDLGPGEANAKPRPARCLRYHFQKHEVGEQVGDLRRIDMLSARQLPGRRLGGEVVVQATKARVSLKRKILNHPTTLDVTLASQI